MKYVMTEMRAEGERIKGGRNDSDKEDRKEKEGNKIQASE
jgi:hypothetical protein